MHGQGGKSASNKDSKLHGKGEGGIQCGTTEVEGKLMEGTSKTEGDATRKSRADFRDVRWLTSRKTSPVRARDK